MSMTRSSLREEEESGLDFSESHKKYSFFVFVDPLSGLGCGKAFLKLETQKLCLMLDGDAQHDRTNGKERRNKYDIHVYFYDMSCAKTMEVACERLKISHLQKYRKVRIIVCGDESSLCHVVPFCENMDIPIENYPFGIIPSDYCNDLSSVLGWGDVETEDLVGTDLKFIKILARKWVKAIIEKIDLWAVTIQVEEDGEIQTVDRQTRLKVFQKEKTVTTCMISHLNIGVHARIQLGFDQKKSTESNVANKWIHAFEGFKKMMCMSTKVDKMVSLVEIETKQNGDDKVYRTLFSTKKEEEEGNKPEQKYLQGSPVSLVCLNINSYRGNREAWKEAEQSGSRKRNLVQSIYDGKLQFLTYSNVMSSQGKRVCQTDGGININLQKDNPAYIQIDGACFKLTRPKKISIAKKSRLQVLINSESLK